MNTEQATLNDTYGESLNLSRWSANRGIDSINNYSGPDLNSWFEGPGQGRDSGVLTQSNFAVALDMLGGESETVEVRRFGHWACGWFELILVHEADHKALKVLAEIGQALEDYPVLDDMDYSEREYEYLDETFEYYEFEFTKSFVDIFGEKFTATINPSLLSEYLRYLFREDAGYRGAENAYLDEDSILRAIGDTWVYKRSELYNLHRRVLLAVDRLNNK